MDDLKGKSNNTNNKSKCNNNTSQDKGIGLENLSYADFIVLSSILAYAIAEELNNTDLDLFIVFLGIVQSDLATLRLQRGIKNSNNGAIVAEIDTTDIGAKDSVIPNTRYSKIKKVKRIKRKKMKRNKGNK